VRKRKRKEKEKEEAEVGFVCRHWASAPGGDR